MPTASGFFSVTSATQLTPAQAQAIQAQAEAASAAAAANAAASAAARALADAQAAQTRQQAEEFKNNLRDQIRNSIRGERDVNPAMQVPPIPPVPPVDFGTHMPSEDFPQIPQQAVEIVSILGLSLVFCVVGFPIARAFARWIDRRGVSAAASSDVSNRLRAIEQAVESVAIEVERISEGQRFTTRVLSERSAEPVSDFLGRDRDAVHAGLPLDAGPGAPVNTRRS